LDFVLPLDGSMYMNLRPRSSITGGDYQSRSRDLGIGTTNVGIAAARTGTDDRGMEPKADVLYQTGKLDNRDNYSGLLPSPFFA
jgi:hypothetical protein